MLQWYGKVFISFIGEQNGRVGATSRICQSSPCIQLSSLQLNLATAFMAIRRLFLSRRSHPCDMEHKCFPLTISSSHYSLRSSLTISPSVASPGLSTSLSSSPIPPQYPPLLTPFPAPLSARAYATTNLSNHHSPQLAIPHSTSSNSPSATL